MKEVHKILHDVELTKTQQGEKYDYIAEFIWDASEGQTTYYTCYLTTEYNREWVEVAEGGYVVASGWEYTEVVTDVSDITFWREFDNGDLDQSGEFNPTEDLLKIWVVELDEALAHLIRYEN